MKLELTDEQSEALTQGLCKLIEGDLSPQSPHPGVEGDPGQAAAGARAPVAGPIPDGNFKPTKGWGLRQAPSERARAAKARYLVMVPHQSDQRAFSIAVCAALTLRHYEPPSKRRYWRRR